MHNPVEFALATSNHFPTGTGSFGYKGSFQVVVQNLAYQKQVSIWTQVGAVWQDKAASYVKSLPGDVEIWSVQANNSEGEFVARYTVNSAGFWDNNGGKNYKFPIAADEFIALAGAEYKVVLGVAGMSGGVFNISIGVQNLAFNKVVRVIFTTDDWTTVQTAFASYSSTMESGLEVWKATAPVGSAGDVKFAILYQVLGSEFWDNNFWRNYTVTPTSSKSWGE